MDQGETLEEAVKREVFEETGIETDYIGVIGFREQLNFRFAVSSSVGGLNCII